MVRTVKVLNNNSVLAIDTDTENEVIILGKGVGFGKKVSERFQPDAGNKVYQLEGETKRGNTHELLSKIDPKVLEVTSDILQKAQEKWPDIDTGILVPLSDHIAFAVERIRSRGGISNPMTSDIRTLFAEEYAVARYGAERIAVELGVEINSDEKGYIALHLHSAWDNVEVSSVMKDTQLIHHSLCTIEERMHTTLDDESLAYNRLLSHMKYMLFRMKKGEGIELDMNLYLQHQYPETFALAQEICDGLAEEMKLSYKEEEIGYLAMHIERVCKKNLQV